MRLVAILFIFASLNYYTSTSYSQTPPAGVHSSGRVARQLFQTIRTELRYKKQNANTESPAAECKLTDSFCKQSMTRIMCKWTKVLAPRQMVKASCTYNTADNESRKMDDRLLPFFAEFIVKSTDNKLLVDCTGDQCRFREPQDVACDFARGSTPKRDRYLCFITPTSLK